MTTVSSISLWILYPSRQNLTNQPKLNIEVGYNSVFGRHDTWHSIQRYIWNIHLILRLRPQTEIEQENVYLTFHFLSSGSGGSSQKQLREGVNVEMKKGKISLNREKNLVFLDELALFSRLAFSLRQLVIMQLRTVYLLRDKRRFSY